MTEMLHYTAEILFWNFHMFTKKNQTNQNNNQPHKHVFQELFLSSQSTETAAIQKHGHQCSGWSLHRASSG